MADQGEIRMVRMADMFGHVANVKVMSGNEELGYAHKSLDIKVGAYVWMIGACGYDAELKVARRVEGNHTVALVPNEITLAHVEATLAAMVMQAHGLPIRITDHDGGRPLPSILSFFEDFARENADGIDAVELAAIEATVRDGRPYHLAGFVGGFATIEPVRASA